MRSNDVDLKIGTWRELADVESQFDTVEEDWIFRGQSSATWPLSTTLDRVAKAYEISADHLREIENAQIVDFKRTAHLYSPEHLPFDDDTIGWMALMRHYGAPSRLIDFTRSFFAAAYFALQGSGESPVIWAVSKTWLTEHFQSRVGELPGGKDLLVAWGNREGAAFDGIILDDPTRKLIAPVNPLKMNERLVRQQGLFLCASRVTQPFQEILESIAGSEENLAIIHCPAGAERRQLLLKLYRAGISHATLFPGLEGFAESLRIKTIMFQRMLMMRGTGARLGPNVTGV